jgi:hypothetical protein
MSDGTSRLRFLDPDTLKETGGITVTDEGRPVDQLNELEWVKGEIYANVWQTDRIARIDPASGKVTGWIDLTGLLPVADRARADVLNGIAYDAKADRLIVTGKLWPRLYEIRVGSKITAVIPDKRCALSGMTTLLAPWLREQPLSRLAHHGVAARLLGLVHRLVGALEQGLRVSPAPLVAETPIEIVTVSSSLPWATRNGEPETCMRIRSAMRRASANWVSGMITVNSSPP